jgi:hypothetical protein
MSIAQKLSQAIDHGIHRIGQIEIQRGQGGHAFVLCHEDDIEISQMTDFGGLETHAGPEAARDLSTYSEDGVYRFTKGQTNLRRGWVMLLDSDTDLRLALDHFYPASVGVWLAHRDGSIEIEHLRDKLNRQTGMYRSAKFISESGAQELVQKICGPAHQCAKRILWKIDSETDLADSEASRFNGIWSGLPETEAIPLLCREACNHFVSECRKVSKAENDAKKSSV